MDDLKLHGLIGGSGNIKSIQRGSFNRGASSQNIAINPVDPMKSIVILSSYVTDGAISRSTFRGYLVDGTTLNVSSGSGYGSLDIISWQVIEFANIKQMQIINKTITVPINISSPVKYTDTTSINAVKLSKTMVFHNFNNNNTSSNYSFATASIVLDSPTQLSFSMLHSVERAQTIQFVAYIVEFN